ncbi:MAG: DUF6115 domain-containing protein [Lachnospiraceae bacterium]
MGALEIILLIAGIIIIVLSFILPVENKTLDYETKKMIRQEIEAAVGAEMENIRQRMEEVTDESISYAMEKTERSLERISNEKIMAVNDFSETVLSEIDKSHKEAVFLYDMLNEKHKAIKNTVTEVEQQVKRAKDSCPEENVDEKLQRGEQEAEQSAKTAKKETEFKALTLPQADKADKKRILEKPEVQEISDKDKILAMHNEGMSDIEIAIVMGCGIGEVKLVIELFEGTKS